MATPRGTAKRTRTDTDTEDDRTSKRARTEDDEFSSVVPTDPNHVPDPVAPFDTLATAEKGHMFYASTVALSGQALRETCKEWTTLGTNLSQGVYFRCFGDRMDLQRFLIMGAPGTCYYNGYFLFDMQLAANHPCAPPTVRFHSFNAVAHPYLHRDGKVCLSLLGTIETTNPSEKWRPGHSTLLQVVTSIQGLILGDTSYYKTQRRIALEGLVWSLRTHIKLVNAPPAEFATLIRDHFKRAGRETHDLVSFLTSTPPDGKKHITGPMELLRKYGIDAMLPVLHHCRGPLLSLVPDLELAIAIHGAPW